MLEKSKVAMFLVATLLIILLFFKKLPHYINQDTLNPSKMLVKIVVEKAYDTLKWNAILATLTRMNFPNT